MFAKLFEADGMSYPELCDRLVQLAVERYEAERATSSSRPGPERAVMISGGVALLTR